MTSLFAKKIIGLHIHLTATVPEIKAVLCIQKGDEFLIEKEYADLSAIKDVKEIVGATTAVACVFTGKGIVHHKLQNPFETLAKSLREKLPDARADLFVCELNQHRNYMSISRKDNIDTYLKQLHEHAIFPSSIHIGGVLGESILPIIAEPTIKMLPYELHQSEGQLERIKTITTSSLKYTIADKQVDASSLLALSVALEYSTQLDFLKIGLEPYEEEGRAAYKYNKYANKLLSIGLALVFIVLLANFMIFNKLSTKTALVEGQLYHAQSLITQVDSLQKQYKDKQQALSKIGPQKNSNLSYLADQIAKSLPDGIRLHQLELYPPVQQKRQKKSIGTYKQNLIFIKGSSQYSYLLDNWISLLEKLEWVKSVHLLPYKESSKAMGLFEIELELK